MDGEEVKISIQWSGAWEDKSKTYREGGSMVLLASPKGTIQIREIKGDSPFGISQRLKGQQK